MAKSWLLAALAMVCCAGQTQSAPDLGWPNHGNDAGGMRYSAAQQIDRTNLAQLKLAWTYRTGALQQQTEMINKAAFESTPILVENKLFLSTPPEDIRWCHDKIQASRWEGMFTPPSLQGTIMFPGNVGGVNWGSAAYDPIHHTMVANTNRLIAWIKLIPRDQYKGEQHKQQDNRIFGEFGDQEGAPYGLYRTFLFSPSRTPCNAPPWGTTEAVGKELWQYQLPAGGQATPMSYNVHGKQYIVIAAGGHGKLRTKQGDYILAFALP
jgi:glucose dehydrogenase